MSIDSVMLSHAAFDLTTDVKQKEKKKKKMSSVHPFVTLYDDEKSQIYLTIPEIYGEHSNVHYLIFSYSIELSVHLDKLKLC